MRSLLLAFGFILLNASLARAQAVSVNTDGSAPAPTAILDIKSTNKGVLVPRMTSAQRLAIGAPVAPDAGLLVYDTDTGGFWYYNGSAWVNLGAGGGATAATYIADTDGNTRVQTEKNANENIIRFDLGGTENAVLRKNSAGVPRLEITNAQGNTFVGLNTGDAATAASNNTALGINALASTTAGNGNTAAGVQALLLNSTGAANTAAGYQVMLSNTTGSNNAAFGREALRSGTTGSNNTAIGRESLRANTTGFSNTALGASALQSNTDRSNLVAAGDSALYSNGLGAT